jgi:hypothetical protein
MLFEGGLTANYGEYQNSGKAFSAEMVQGGARRVQKSNVAHSEADLSQHYYRFRRFSDSGGGDLGGRPTSFVRVQKVVRAVVLSKC